MKYAHDVKNERNTKFVDKTNEFRTNLKSASGCVTHDVQRLPNKFIKTFSSLK